MSRILRQLEEFLALKREVYFLLSLILLFCLQLHISIEFISSSGRNQPAHYNVLFQPSQMVNLSVETGFCQDASGLLKSRSGYEAIRAESTLGDPQQQRSGFGWFSAFFDDFFVLFLEDEFINLFISASAG